MNETTGRMGRNVLWNTVGSIFYYICQWITTVLVVRLGSYSLSGVYSLAMTTSSSFAAISLFSMRNYQVSDTKGDFSDSTYFSSRVVSCLGAQLVCMTVAFLAAQTFLQFAYTSLFMVIRLAEALTDVLHGMDQHLNHYDWVGKSYIMRGLFSVVPFALCLWLAKDLLLAMIVMAILNIGISIGYDYRKTSRKTRLLPIRLDALMWTLLRNCSPLVICTLMLNLVNLVPKMLLEKKMGTELLGVYSAIANPTLIVQVVASMVFVPFLPNIAKLIVQKEYKIFRNVVWKVLLMWCAMGVVVTLGALAVGRFGLRILYNESILEYYDIFMPVVWTTIGVAGVWVLMSVVVAMRKIPQLLIGIALGFGVCMGTASILIDRFGMNGTSYCQIFALGIMMVYLTVLCMKQK